MADCHLFKFRASQMCVFVVLYVFMHFFFNHLEDVRRRRVRGEELRDLEDVGRARGQRPQVGL